MCYCALHENLPEKKWKIKIKGKKKEKTKRLFLKFQFCSYKAQWAVPSLKSRASLLFELISTSGRKNAFWEKRSKFSFVKSKIYSDVCLPKLSLHCSAENNKRLLHKPHTRHNWPLLFKKRTSKLVGSRDCLFR